MHHLKLHAYLVLVHSLITNCRRRSFFFSRAKVRLKGFCKIHLHFAWVHFQVQCLGFYFYRFKLLKDNFVMEDWANIRVAVVAELGRAEYEIAK